MKAFNFDAWAAKYDATEQRHINDRIRRRERAERAVARADREYMILGWIVALSGFFGGLYLLVRFVKWAWQ